MVSMDTNEANNVCVYEARVLLREQMPHRLKI